MEFLHRTWAEIDLGALRHNFDIIKSEAKGAKIIAVVKANAYGHDFSIIAPALQRYGADMFAVSNIIEALELRHAGINKPILILGYTPANAAGILSQNDISQCVYSTEYAQSLSEYAVKEKASVKIHIKLDTGMGRLGFDCRSDNLYGIKDAVAAAVMPGFKLEGAFTHFAVSDRTEENDDGFTEEQYFRFLKGIKVMRSHGLSPEICHCCNSAAFCLDTDKHLDACRTGIIMYGLTPSSDLKLKENFIPVMSFKSVVSFVKDIAPGDTINYGRTFRADKRMRVATVAVGYADGYPRALSGKGFVIINGVRAPIIGRVCMDQMSVDVSHIPEVKMGDEVLLFGKELPVEEISEICGTINYETVCTVGNRVPRIAVNE